MYSSFTHFWLIVLWLQTIIDFQLANIPILNFLIPITIWYYLLICILFWFPLYFHLTIFSFLLYLIFFNYPYFLMQSILLSFIEELTGFTSDVGSWYFFEEISPILKLFSDSSNNVFITGFDCLIMLISFCKSIWDFNSLSNN